jgi:arsenate reductase
VTILGRGRFRGFSAGSKPGGIVNPYAIEQIKRYCSAYATDSMRSKSWDEFAAADAPRMDVIITVCDNAAGEVCPYWPGKPATAHWGFADPAGVEGTAEQKRAAFARIFKQIFNKINAFAELPVETMTAQQIQTALKKIGEAPV